MKTLCRWKVDIWGFPTVCHMTHFEYQKVFKIAFENRVKKLCAGANFHMADKIATWQLQYPRVLTLRSAA